MATVLRAAAAYIFLFIVIRIIGRRSVSQMTPVELIVIFLFGGMTIQAIVTDNRSLVNAFLGVMTVGVMHVVVATLKQKYPKFRLWADGAPMVVLAGGKWLQDRMDAVQIQQQDVMAAARKASSAQKRSSMRSSNAMAGSRSFRRRRTRQIRSRHIHRTRSGRETGKGGLLPSPTHGLDKSTRRTRMPDQSREERPHSADAAVLKDEIDSGRTRDKVPWFDPGAAPLGTDAESAGNPPPASASITDSPASQGEPAGDSGNDRAVYELQDRLIWPVIIGLCALLAVAAFLFTWFRV